MNHHVAVILLEEIRSFADRCLVRLKAAELPSAESALREMDRQQAELVEILVARGWLLDIQAPGTAALQNPAFPGQVVSVRWPAASRGE